MDKIKLQQAVNMKDAQMISKLAFQIWREHYIPIIGSENVEYMLDVFQKPEHIYDAIHNGYEYYSIWYEQQLAGYAAIKPDAEHKRLFLSKLYIHKDFRKKGLAHYTLTCFEKTAAENGILSVWLMVNQDNVSSQEFYKKMGFVKESSFKNDFGNGVIMDDYIMVKKIR